MPVTQELLNKISEYEKQGYSSDEIVQGLSESPTFPDIAAKTQNYLSKGYKSDEILSGMKSSPVETATQKASTLPPPEIPQWGRDYPNLYGAAGAARETLGPAIEALGMVGGAAAGATAGTVASAPTGFTGALPLATAGGATGAGLGYAGALNLLKQVDYALGNKTDPGVVENLKKLPEEVATGAAMEAGGQVTGKAITQGLEYGGKLGKEILGATTGAGPGTVEEALKRSQAFKDAMRGKITGEEIVDNAKSAVATLKEYRGAAYRSELEALTKDKEPIDMSPLKQKVMDWLKRYNVKPYVDNKTMQYKLDFSNSKLPDEAATKVSDAFNDILRWPSTPGNNTVVGLDTLKQRLGNYYSDSSAARAIIADLESATKKMIVKEVPQYAKMTKGYEEATNLIRDIESNLMLKKQGISGRITADQTLRRLTSAMRENFELRRDLVNTLGEQSGQDVAGQVAGYAANQLIPRGLVGKMAGGSVLYALNPKLWPILAASSPRLVGEFLSIYGKGLAETTKQLPGGSVAMYKTLGMMELKALQDLPPDYKTEDKIRQLVGD